MTASAINRFGCICMLGCVRVLAGCAGEDVSIGDLRCERTHCAVPEAIEMGVHGVELAEIDAGEARVVWTAQPPSCGDDCRDVAHEIVMVDSTDEAQWVVHGDGSLTTARTFVYAPPGERIWRTGVSLARFDADGALLSENHELARDEPMTTDEILPEPRIALAADGQDAALLALGGWRDDPFALVVYAVPASLELEPILELPAGGAPNALAAVGEELLIAGVYYGNVELGRYRRDGRLLWRQTALLPDSEFAQPKTAASGLQLAADSAGRSALAVPGGPAYVLSEVAANGDVLNAMWFAALDRQHVKAQVAFDGEDRLVLAFDAYLLLRCRPGSCSFDGSDPVMAFRTRDAYYAADVLGLDIDADDRIYVLTHDGVRSQHRVLLDRISADFTRRETFVVAGGDALIDPETDSSMLAHEIRIGPQGDVYVWTHARIGRIALP